MSHIPTGQASVHRTLADWLAHCDALHAQAGSGSLERARDIHRRLGIEFTAPVVIVAGTNGKGSSCAMLESIAQAAGYRVGVYSQPHLVHFEERCRIGGEPVSEAELLPHFEAVEAARDGEPLIWFAFTTLVILRLLAQRGLDLVVLEVGIGGRLDAVNIVDADVALLTSIDLDHTALLGPDRESIGLEKAHVMRPGRPAVVADPLPPASVLAHAAAIGADLRRSGVDFHFDGDRQQWRWAGRTKRWPALGYPALRGANQLVNAAGVLAVFEALAERLPVSAQAVRTGLATVALAGRFQVVPGEPALVLDVSHNLQSVAVLATNLDAMGYFPRTLAVFGAMHDKALDAMLARIRPLIDVWHLCALPTPRAEPVADVAARLAGAEVHLHADPAAALAAAWAAADPADRIVVFGSFYTVGGVLKSGLPRATAPHLGASG